MNFGNTKYKSELVKEFRRGPYVIRHENIFMEDGPMLMKSAYSPEGLFIGDTKRAHWLWKDHGIETFKPISKKSTIASIGYSPSKKKWYGWSHRAIKGFKSREYAIRFARSVA